MNALVLDFDQAESALTISGETRTVWENRRLAIFLRDYQQAVRAGEDQIKIPAIKDTLGPHVNRIEETLKKHGYAVNRSESLSRSIADFVRAENQFAEFSKRAKEIWHNDIPPPEFGHFVSVVSKALVGRTLYPLQLLAAYHLAFAQNAANFSVPGAGKTSIVYAALAYLRSLPTDDPKHVNKLFVVGPLSSFGPWESEYEKCFGVQPRSYRLSGGISQDARKRVLYSDLPEYRDVELVLTSYQGITNDALHIEHFLTRPCHRVMVVLDEAHKIKNTDGGIWAEATLRLAPLAAARIVLTGTPAPNGYEDLYNLFRFIWPNHEVIKYRLHHLREMSQNPFDRRTETLLDNVTPFFIRIRKSDLRLPSPNEHPPILVPMGPRQDRIYRFIEERYVQYLELGDRQTWVRDTLVKARLIRLMQAATNPALLRKPIESSSPLGDAEAPLLVDDADILGQILDYEGNEQPAKLLAAADLVAQILEQAGERVVVWCVFIDNLFAMQRMLLDRGIGSRVLYGATPTESETEDPQLGTRESIIREFNEATSACRVIIANPFAVGESISLHTICRHAIYLERNFNAAAFLQSKDRIHRYGLPPDAKVNYHYFCARDSVDETVHRRLLEKEATMNRIMESRTIPLLNMNFEAGEDEDRADDVAAILKDYAKRRSETRRAD